MSRGDHLPRLPYIMSFGRVQPYQQFLQAEFGGDGTDQSRKQWIKDLRRPRLSFLSRDSKSKRLFRAAAFPRVPGASPSPSAPVLGLKVPRQAAAVPQEILQLGISKSAPTLRLSAGQNKNKLVELKQVGRQRRRSTTRKQARESKTAAALSRIDRSFDGLVGDEEVGRICRDLRRELPRPGAARQPPAPPPSQSPSAAAAACSPPSPWAGTTALDLGTNSITDVGAAKLAAVLRSAPAAALLTSLDLDQNEIEAEGAAKLARALIPRRPLTKKQERAAKETQAILGLSGQAFLRGGASLTVLDMSANDIGDEGASSLGQALRVNRSLTALKLGDCGIGSAGLEALACGLCVNGGVMLELNLWGNSVGPAGLQALSAAWAGRKAAALERWGADCVGTAPGCALQKLDLTSAGVGDDGVEALCAVGGGSGPMHTIEVLDLGDNHLSLRGLDAIAKACGDRDCKLWSLTLDHAHWNLGSAGSSGESKQRSSSNSMTENKSSRTKKKAVRVAEHRHDRGDHAAAAAASGQATGRSPAGVLGALLLGGYDDAMMAGASNRMVVAAAQAVALLLERRREQLVHHELLATLFPQHARMGRAPQLLS